MYLIYNKTTGVVIRQLYCDESSIHGQLSVSEDYLVLDALEGSENDYYVQDKLLVKKQDYTLDNLPLPCTITIEGVPYEITEQPTFEFDVAGEYLIEVDAGVKYLKKEFVYVAEA